MYGKTETKLVNLILFPQLVFKVNVDDIDLQSDAMNSDDLCKLYGTECSTMQ